MLGKDCISVQQRVDWRVGHVGGSQTGDRCEAKEVGIPRSSCADG